MYVAIKHKVKIYIFKIDIRKKRCLIENKNCKNKTAITMVLRQMSLSSRITARLKIKNIFCVNKKINNDKVSDSNDE